MKSKFRIIWQWIYGVKFCLWRTFKFRLVIINLSVWALCHFIQPRMLNVERLVSELQVGLHYVVGMLRKTLLKCHGITSDYLLLANEGCWQRPNPLGELRMWVTIITISVHYCSIGRIPGQHGSASSLGREVPHPSVLHTSVLSQCSEHPASIFVLWLKHTLFLVWG